MSQRTISTTLLLLLCGASLFFGPNAAAAPSARTIQVSGSLQAALDAARPGDILLLAAKTYRERVTIRPSGSATAPITLRGAGRSRSVIAGTITIQGAFWKLEDFAVDVGGADRDAIKLNAPSRDLAIRRVHLFNGKGYGVRVGNDVTRVTIEESVIERFDAGTRDAHGIGIMTASAVTIRRCEIFATSGDAIQVNTPDYPGYGRFARDILIEQNRLHDTRENALDIKSTHGLTARHNLIWGFRAVDSSDGMAIQVQYDAQDINLVGNQIWSAVEGVEVSRGTKNGTAYPLAPQRVLIAGNLIRELVHDPAGDSGSGSGIVIRSSAAVRVYNNSVLGAPGAGLYVGVSREGDYPQGLDVRNNLLGGQTSDLQMSFTPKLAPGLTIDYNHYSGARVNGASLKEWLARGIERHASSGDPRLDASSLLPSAGSPLRDSGTGVGMPFSGAAPDRGWGELNDPAVKLASLSKLFLPLLAQ